jgi:hypothetical protein
MDTFILVELLAQVFPRVHRAPSRQSNYSLASALSASGNQFAITWGPPLRDLYGHGVDMQELTRIRGPVVLGRDAGMELVRSTSRDAGHQ